MEQSYIQPPRLIPNLTNANPATRVESERTTTQAVTPIVVGTDSVFNPLAILWNIIVHPSISKSRFLNLDTGDFLEELVTIFVPRGIVLSFIDVTSLYLSDMAWVLSQYCCY